MRSQKSAISTQQSVDSDQKSGFLKRLYAESRMLNARVSNEKGIALMMVLVLSAILLAIMAGLVYMLISGTQISGIQKRYKTALEAAVGGADVTFQFISARGNPFDTATANAIYYSIALSPTCLSDKLTKSTADWNAACNSSVSITPGNTATYDTSFLLGTVPVAYTVYSKIVDTVEGNSGGDEGLLKTGVVSANPGEVTVKSIPYLYTIEVDAENTTNPAERTKLSILYQY